MSITFSENMERDVELTRLAIDKSVDACLLYCMRHPDFARGPDAFVAYSKWISAPERREYRARIAEQL